MKLRILRSEPDAMGPPAASASGGAPPNYSANRYNKELPLTQQGGPPPRIELFRRDGGKKKEFDDQAESEDRDRWRCGIAMTNRYRSRSSRYDLPTVRGDVLKSNRTLMI